MLGTGLVTTVKIKDNFAEDVLDNSKCSKLVVCEQTSEPVM